MNHSTLILIEASAKMEADQEKHGSPSKDIHPVTASSQNSACISTSDRPPTVPKDQLKGQYPHMSGQARAAFAGQTLLEPLEGGSSSTKSVAHHAEQQEVTKAPKKGKPKKKKNKQKGKNQQASQAAQTGRAEMRGLPVPAESQSQLETVGETCRPLLEKRGTSRTKRKTSIDGVRTMPLTNTLLPQALPIRLTAASYAPWDQPEARGQGHDHYTHFHSGTVYGQEPQMPPYGYATNLDSNWPASNNVFPGPFMAPLGENDIENIGSGHAMPYRQPYQFSNLYTSIYGPFTGQSNTQSGSFQIIQSLQAPRPSQQARNADSSTPRARTSQLTHEDLAKLQIKTPNRDRARSQTPEVEDLQRNKLKRVPRPAPSFDYFKRATTPLERLSSPQRLLIISDLNGTLIVRPRRGTAFKRRPGLTSFLEYLFSNHRLMVWTSSMPYTMDIILNGLFTPEQRKSCAAAWARDTLGLTKAQYDGKVQVYKKLDEVWANESVQSTHPDHSCGGRWDQSNTLLVDDSELKAVAQPYNLVNIPELTLGKLGQEVKTSIMAQVAGYIEEARWWSNVSAFAKKTPFKAGHGWECKAQDRPGFAKVGSGTVEPELSVN